MILDQSTLLIAIGIAASGLTVALLVAWAATLQDSYLLSWGIGLTLIVASVIVYGVYGEPYIPALHLVAFELLIAGFALTHLGARQFRRGAVSPSLSIALWAVFAASTGLTFLAGYSGIGTALTNLACGVFFGLCGVELWRGRAEAPLAIWAQSLLYWLTAVSFLLCAIVLMGSGQFILTARPENWAEDINSLVIIVAMAGIGALALATNQLRATTAERTRASTDALTGLLNRRALFNAVGDGPLPYSTAVIMLDLDHFKAVNDSFGHAAGDDLLVRFAALVQTNLRPSDLAARLGGEEFCAVLEQIDADEAADIAERIRTALEKLGPLSALHGPPTVSAGVAMAAGRLETFDDVLRRADAALYSAKENGRNRVQCADMPDPRAFSAAL